MKQVSIGAFSASYPWNLFSTALSWCIWTFITSSFDCSKIVDLFILCGYIGIIPLLCTQKAPSNSLITSTKCHKFVFPSKSTLTGVETINQKIFRRNFFLNMKIISIKIIFSIKIFPTPSPTQCSPKNLCYVIL